MGIRKPVFQDTLRSKLAGKRFDERTIAWTVEELETYLKRELKDSTVSQRLRDLARMATHEVRPVNLTGSPGQLLDSFLEFDSYRKTVEMKAGTARVNDHKSLRLLVNFLNWKSLRAGGSVLIPMEIFPSMPHVPKRARQLLPSPEMVHDLIFAKFVPGDEARSYENALVKYLLVFDFGFGVRYPSEPHALRLEWFDPDYHTLIVEEPKKGNPTRRLQIEPEWLCCGSNRPSLKTYVEKWRAKVDDGGRPEFWLKPNGEPFRSKFDLSDWLCERVKPVAERLGYGQHGVRMWHPYMGRKWCANARLIDSKWNYPLVAQWLGHESVSELMKSYDEDSHVLHKRYATRDAKGKLVKNQPSWLTRAFCKTAKPANSSGKAVSAPLVLSPPVTVDAPAGERTRQQERATPVARPKSTHRCDDGPQTSPPSSPDPLSPDPSPHRAVCALRADGRLCNSDERLSNRSERTGNGGVFPPKTPLCSGKKEVASRSLLAAWAISKRVDGLGGADADRHGGVAAEPDVVDGDPFALGAGHPLGRLEGSSSDVESFALDRVVFVAEGEASDNVLELRMRAGELGHRSVSMHCDSICHLRLEEGGPISSGKAGVPMAYALPPPVSPPVPLSDIPSYTSCQVVARARARTRDVAVPLRDSRFVFNVGHNPAYVQKCPLSVSVSVQQCWYLSVVPSQVHIAIHIQASATVTLPAQCDKPSRGGSRSADRHKQQQEAKRGMTYAKSVASRCILVQAAVRREEQGGISGAYPLSTYA